MSNQIALQVVAHGDGHVMFRPVVGDVLLAGVPFPNHVPVFAAIVDAVVVTTVGERLEPDVAVLVVPFGVDDLAVPVHEFELELVDLQPASGQTLACSEFHEHVLRLVRVSEADAVLGTVFGGVFGLRGQRVTVRILGDGDGDGVDGPVVGDATQIAVLFGHGVRVHAGPVERELVEFEGSFPFADVRRLVGLRVAWNAGEPFGLEEVAVGILQFGGELAIVQITSGQTLVRLHGHVNGCRRVRVVESDVRGLTVGGGREHAALVGDGDGHVVFLSGVSDGLVRSGELLHVVRVRAGLGVRHPSEREPGSLVGDGQFAVAASVGHRDVAGVDGIVVRIMRGRRVQLERELAVLRDATGRRVRVDDAFRAADGVSDVLRIVPVGERDGPVGIAGGWGHGLGRDAQPARVSDVLDHVGDGRHGPVLGDARNGRILFRHGEHVGADERERQSVEPDVAVPVVPFRLVGVRHVGGRGLLVEGEGEVVALSGYLLPSDALILLTAVGVSVAGCARYVFVNSGMAVPPSYFTSASSCPSPSSVTVT